MSLVFFFIGKICLAASPMEFFKENENNAAAFPKFSFPQERVLATNTTFSKSYSPFGNITSFGFLQAVVTNFGRYMTCGYIQFNDDLSNALVGIINEDGSEVVHLSIGNND